MFSLLSGEIFSATVVLELKTYVRPSILKMKLRYKNLYAFNVYITRQSERIKSSTHMDFVVTSLPNCFNSETIQPYRVYLQSVPREKGNTSSISGPGSSVGIATELRAGRSGDRIPVGARFSSRPDVQWVLSLSRG
jgi:hypothetical protein